MNLIKFTLIEKDVETVCLEYNKICNNIANVEF